MKLPIRWLKKYIETDLSAEKLEEMLTMSGSKVEAVEQKGAESVIEIEVTTNRPDCLSILGLAYEVSALTGKEVNVPAVYRKTESLDKEKKASFDITVQDKKACPLYTARIIENVKVKSSPLEVQQLLDLSGTRAISHPVDATNFVLFECGQPLHVFDLDKIKGSKIIVRYAIKGEKFLGIDGIEYSLDEKTLVIADAERAIAVAGVIGGKLTEVTESTKNILLESAYFDPALVRQAARRYKISTDSSYRFERGVDVALVEAASRRACELMGEWSPGQVVAGSLTKNNLPKAKAGSVVLRVDRVEKILGIAVSQKRILDILKSLSLEAKASGKKKVVVSQSSFRRDLLTEVDLIEEILRIEGFEKIPVVLPSARYNEMDPESQKAAKTPELKKMLAALGFSEIITYSLISAKLLTDAAFEPEKTHRVVNTIGAGQEFFRPSLLPGMLEAALFNIHRKANSLKLFEVGNCYLEGKEETLLGLLMCGSLESNWQRKSDVSFYDLKGILENVLKFAGARDGRWQEGTRVSSLDQGSVFFEQDRVLARLGCVAQSVLKNFGITQDVYYAEISLQQILSRSPRVYRVKPVAKFPLVKRDLAFVVDEKVSVAEIQTLMKESAGAHLSDVTLFDQYIGKNIAAGHRSLAFSLSYQKDTATFTDSEIQALQERVGQALKSRYAVEFR